MRLGYHVSICRKSFAFTSKQLQQVPKHFEIKGENICGVQTKTAETVKVLTLKCFVLYGIAISIATSVKHQVLFNILTSGLPYSTKL